MRYPDAVYRPLAKKQGEPAMLKHTIICLHTMVGYLTSTDAMFRENGYTGTESHFGIGGIWGADGPKGYDGTVFQWQDTAFSADANLDGWDRVISIETADNAPKFVKDIKPWTPKQLTAIVKLVTWLCRQYNIPPVLIADTKQSRSGIGYHRQGCEHSLGVGKVPGFLVVGGERWSEVVGKECPGHERIAQLKAIVIPRVKLALNPPKPIPIPKPPAPVEIPMVNPLDEWRLKLTTQFQVDTMNAGGPATPYKIGDYLDLRRLFMWGGPKDERLLAELRGIAQDVEGATEREKRDVQLQRIEDALAVLTANIVPPTETGAPRAV